MPVLNPGRFRHWVDLDDPDPDTSVTFNPSRVKAAVRPSSPGAFDEQKVTHIVEMRYHPQVTFNTRITHRSRSLYVKGFQNVDEQRRELVLLCEEVMTPA